MVAVLPGERLIPEPATAAPSDVASPGSPEPIPESTHDATHADETAPVLPPAGSGRTGASDVHAEFLAFMAESGPALGKLAYFLAGDVHAAEDLLQHTYVRTLAAWPRVRAGNPHAFARRVMTNHRVDLWRRLQRERPTPARLPETAVPDSSVEVAERDALVLALRTLPTRRRQVVVMRYLAGLPEADVAEALDISVGTVKSTAARGLAQLKQALDGRGEGR